jgi:predicted S18 family serine protease
MAIGDILLVDVTVGFLKKGDGPNLIGDPRLGKELHQAFIIAGVVACQAIGYDPRYIAVRLVFPAARVFEQGFYIDGPSVGVSGAVAVASAMLGDSVHPKMCMTGVVTGPNIGPVGGIDKKLEGCRRLGFTDMIIPRGQDNLAISSAARKLRIAIKEVRTLEEAYKAATGKRLRRVCK